MQKSTKKKKKDPPVKWTDLQRWPNVKGDLLLHDDVQETALLLVLHPAARGLDLLLQWAVPLTTIWGG